jgi:S-adenosyl methyltransferase
VLSHAQALLKTRPEGACACVDADLRDPEDILAAARDTLDFTRPVAVMLVATLQLIDEADDPAGIVRRESGRRTAIGQRLSACSTGASYWNPAWSGCQSGDPTRNSVALGTRLSGLAWRKKSKPLDMSTQG